MNYFTKQGAETLKKRIEDFWSKQGYIVNVRLVPQGFNVKLRLARWDIKSDLINGRPHNWVKKKEN